MKSLEVVAAIIKKTIKYFVPSVPIKVKLP